MGDKFSARRTPPETSEEWEYIWSASDKATKGWFVVGPVYAIASNWRAWVFAGVLYAFLRRQEVIALLDKITGVGQ